jgi:hypothetical protein
MRPADTTEEAWAALRPEQAAVLAAELGAECYAGADSMRDALATGRPFNLLHMGSGPKFVISCWPSRCGTGEVERSPTGSGAISRG